MRHLILAAMLVVACDSPRPSLVETPTYEREFPAGVTVTKMGNTRWVVDTKTKCWTTVEWLPREAQWSDLDWYEDRCPQGG